MDAPTEERHPGTTSIDTHTSLDILRALNAEDATVAGAVSVILPDLARLVDRAVESLRSGATASRIAALTVIDCLYIAVAQRNLRRVRKAVADTREAVAGHHVTD